MNRRLLTNRNFLLLLSGQLISALGDILYELALMWYVFGATGSAVKTGGVMLADMAAQLLLSLPAGALVDRWNRKATMWISDLIRGAIVLGLAAAVARGGAVPLGLVYLAGFGLRCVSMLFGPARQAILPDVTGAELLLTANVVIGMTGQLVLVIGTAVGGAVVALLGARGALLIDAATFFSSAVTIIAMRIPDSRRAVPAAERTSLLTEIREALAFLATQPLLRYLMSVVLLANFGSLLYSALTPMLVSRVLHGGAGAYGLLNAASVVGALLGGLLVRPLIRRLSAAAAVAGGLAGAGLSAVLLGLTRSLPLAVLLFGTMGLALVFNQMPVNTFLQSQTPGHLRGRVFSAFGMLAALVGPLAVYLGTALADRLAPGAVYITGGAVVIAGALLTVMRRDRLTQVQK